MAKYNWNYIVYDNETGGLSWQKNPITEIALVVLDGSTLAEKEKYTNFIRPYNGLEYNPQALKITGITMNQINSGVETKQIVEDLIQLFLKYTNGTRIKQRPILVAHNGDNFDIDFVKFIFEFNKKNLYDYIERHLEDTMWLARNAWQSEEEELKYNLEACCQKANVSLVDAHRAMNDVEATAELFRFFMRKMRNSSPTKEIQKEATQEIWREKVNFKF